MKYPTLSNKRSYYLFVLVLAHFLWFLAGMCWGNLYNGDSYEYIYLAENMLHGHYYASNILLPLNEWKLTIRPPVYPLFLLLFRNLLACPVWIILILQNLASICSVHLTLKTFREIAPETGGTMWYLLFIILYPAQMYFADMIVPDILFQLFLVLYFRQMITLLRKVSAKNAPVRMSLWLLLAVFTKPIAYPLLYAHFLFFLIDGIRQKSWRPAIAPFLAILLLCAYGLWNKQRTGLYHISSVQGVNLLDWNAAAFLRYRYGPGFSDSAIGMQHRNMEQLSGLKAKYDYASSAAVHILSRDPASYAWFHLRESIRFFFDPGKSELSLFQHGLYSISKYKPLNLRQTYRQKGSFIGMMSQYGYPLWLIVLPTLLFALIRFTGMLLFFFDKEISRKIRLFTAFFVAYFAVAAGPVANSRYFLTVLTITSGAAWIGYGRYRRKKSTVLIQPDHAF